MLNRSFASPGSFIFFSDSPRNTFIEFYTIQNSKALTQTECTLCYRLLLPCFKQRLGRFLAWLAKAITDNAALAWEEDVDMDCNKLGSYIAIAPLHSRWGSSFCQIQMQILIEGGKNYRECMSVCEMPIEKLMSLWEFDPKTLEKIVIVVPYILIYKAHCSLQTLTIVVPHYKLQDPVPTCRSSEGMSEGTNPDLADTAFQVGVTIRATTNYLYD